MSRESELIAWLHAEIAGLHVGSQALRFVRLFAVTLVGQLVLLGTGEWTRAAVVAAIVGAIEIAVRQIWPSVPWPAVVAGLERAGPLLWRGPGSPGANRPAPQVGLDSND